MQEPTEEEIERVLSGRDPVKLPAQGLKVAAVLVPIFKEQGEWRLLLTRRTDKVDHHKGEISFPGGHRDDDDPDLLATALREAREEVGIEQDEVKILGRLDDISTFASGFRIRPFVGVIRYPFEQRLSEEEIEEVIILPLIEFTDPGNFRKEVFMNNGRPFPVCFFLVREYNVWGATARILKQFLEITMGFKEPE